MDTRYTPQPGEFFTVTKNVNGKQWLVEDILLFIGWQGSRFRAYNYRDAQTYSIDIRDADLAPLFDEEVVRKLGGGGKATEQPEPLDAIGQFRVAIATFTAQLNTLSEALQKTGARKS